VYLELQRGGFKPKISVLCPGFVDTNLMNSHRNRPADFADASPPQTGPVADELRKFRERAAEALKKGLSPRAVGERVLAAIQDERFYILTHPNFDPLIEQRMTDILSGNNPMVQPSESLMQKLNALKPN
jgi:hypothetical protein